MTKLKQCRQGDVFVEYIEEPEKPKPARVEKQKRIVLAEGEATGHQHTLEYQDPADWWKDDSGHQFVSFGVPVKFSHPDHQPPIDLRPGTIKVTRQREYSPMETRYVQD